MSTHMEFSISLATLGEAIDEAFSISCGHIFHRRNDDCPVYRTPDESFQWLFTTLSEEQVIVDRVVVDDLEADVRRLRELQEQHEFQRESQVRPLVENKLHKLSVSDEDKNSPSDKANDNSDHAVNTDDKQITILGNQDKVMTIPKPILSELTPIHNGVSKRTRKCRKRYRPRKRRRKDIVLATLLEGEEDRVVVGDLEADGRRWREMQEQHEFQRESQVRPLVEDEGEEDRVVSNDLEADVRRLRELQEQHEFQRESQVRPLVEDKLHKLSVSDEDKNSPSDKPNDNSDHTVKTDDKQITILGNQDKVMTIAKPILSELTPIHNGVSNRTIKGRKRYRARKRRRKEIVLATLLEGEEDRVVVGNLEADGRRWREMQEQREFQRESQVRPLVEDEREEDRVVSNVRRLRELQEQHEFQRESQVRPLVEDKLHKLSVSDEDKNSPSDKTNDNSYHAVNTDDRQITILGNQDKVMTIAKPILSELTPIHNGVSNRIKSCCERYRARKRQRQEIAAATSLEGVEDCFVVGDLEADGRRLHELQEQHEFQRESQARPLVEDEGEEDRVVVNDLEEDVRRLREMQEQNEFQRESLVRPLVEDERHKLSVSDDDNNSTSEKPNDNSDHAVNTDDKPNTILGNHGKVMTCVKPILSEVTPIQNGVSKRTRKCRKRYRPRKRRRKDIVLATLLEGEEDRVVVGDLEADGRRWREMQEQHEFQRESQVRPLVEDEGEEDRVVSNDLEADVRRFRELQEQHEFQRESQVRPLVEDVRHKLSVSGVDKNLTSDEPNENSDNAVNTDDKPITILRNHDEVMTCAKPILTLLELEENRVVVNNLEADVRRLCELQEQYEFQRESQVRPQVEDERHKLSVSDNDKNSTSDDDNCEANIKRINTNS